MDVLRHDLQSSCTQMQVGGLAESIEHTYSLCYHTCQTELKDMLGQLYSKLAVVSGMPLENPAQAQPQGYNPAPQSEQVLPSEEEVVAAVKAMRGEDASLGRKRLLARLRDEHGWSLSEKRLKKIINAHSL